MQLSGRIGTRAARCEICTVLYSSVTRNPVDWPYLIGVIGEVDAMRRSDGVDRLPGEVTVELLEQQLRGTFLVVADCVGDACRHGDVEFLRQLSDVHPVHLDHLHRQTVHETVQPHLHARHLPKTFGGAVLAAFIPAYLFIHLLAT